MRISDWSSDVCSSDLETTQIVAFDAIAVAETLSLLLSDEIAFLDQCTALGVDDRALLVGTSRDIALVQLALLLSAIDDRSTGEITLRRQEIGILMLPALDFFELAISCRSSPKDREVGKEGVGT